MVYMARKAAPADDLTRLKQENQALRRELEQLRQTSDNAASSNRSPVWKRAVILLSAILAASLLVAGNVLFWAGNTIVDPQRFAAVASPLIKEPEVQESISRITADKVFERVDVEQILSENLPPRVEFAAPALAGQVKSATETALTRVMANESFQDTWNSAITTIHGRLITFVKNYEGDGTLQVADIYNKVLQRLEGTKLAFLSNVPLPAQTGAITLANATWLPAAHNVANNISMYQALTTILFIAFTALAIWLARRKRRMAITLGSMFALFTLLTLVAIRITQSIAISGVALENQAAVEVISEHILMPLILQTRALFLTATLIIIVAWISGPYRSATTIRTRIQDLFGGNIHQAVIGSHDNKFTQWLGVHKRVLQWLFVALAAVYIVLAPASVTILVWTVAALVIALLALEIIAAPITSRNRRSSAKAE